MKKTLRAFVLRIAGVGSPAWHVGSGVLLAMRVGLTCMSAMDVGGLRASARQFKDLPIAANDSDVCDVAVYERRFVQR